MRREPRPVLITDAPEDPEREVRRRERRYVATMLLRAACLIGAALLVSTKPPLWPVWAVTCVVGAVFLPWIAVMVANDRPPKTPAERAAEAEMRATPGRRAVSAPGPDRVIEQE